MGDFLSKNHTKKSKILHLALSAGNRNRTDISSLEGSCINHYTIPAFFLQYCKYKGLEPLPPVFTQACFQLHHISFSPR